ncbi:MAG: hypothetical protein OEM67_12400 [Thermoleophilia bacterium]|nr:hypothetical protein [Thermoleophilia bacterium]
MLIGLPAPVRVAYEAGPTGLGHARACEAVRISCTVAAPGRIARAPGARLKNRPHRTLRLARLLCLGELSPVHVLSHTREAIYRASAADVASSGVILRPLDRMRVAG